MGVDWPRWHARGRAYARTMARYGSPALKARFLKTDSEIEGVKFVYGEGAKLYAVERNSQYAGLILCSM